MVVTDHSDHNFPDHTSYLSPFKKDCEKHQTGLLQKLLDDDLTPNLGLLNGAANAQISK
jgi:hypothetical protein